MLLPDATYALQGFHTRLGEALPSNPQKQAYIVRLSRQTLDALDASEHPQLQFELGDKPGIFVDGAFFPIKTQHENIRHELYLRTPSALKPNVPLRLHANITGKLTVEPTLDKDLSEQIQQRTLDAAKQKEVHKTKFIDPPPDLAPPTKQKKKQQAASSMFRRPLRPSDQTARPNPTPASAASTSSAPPPRPRSPPDNPARAVAQSSLRIRLIRYLAKGDRKADDAVKAVAPSCDATHRREILDVLQEIAEPVSASKKDGRLRLKNTSYQHVRPYEWPGLSDSERHTIARAARVALSSLGIPESDPTWTHVVYRPPATTPIAGASAEAPPMRSVVTKAVKEKKGKAKVPEVKTEPKANTKPSVAPKGKETDLGAGSLSASTPPTKTAPSALTRKPPGSGYRAPRSEDGSTSSRVKSEEGSRSRDLPPSSTAPAAPIQRIKKLRQSAGDGHGSDSERPRRDSGGERDKNSRDLASSTCNIKRKKPRDDDDEEYGKSKRRRIGEGASVPSGSRESSSNKKPMPDLAVHPKAIKREPSPLPPLAPAKKAAHRPPLLSQSPQLSARVTAGGSGTANGRSRRHRSPIYTSSEDEGEIKQERQHRSPGPFPSPPTTTPSSMASNLTNAQETQRPLPIDRASLRKGYVAAYGRYIKSFTRLVEQRDRVNALLNAFDDSAGSITDSDGDVELLDVEAMQRLKVEFARHTEELESIRKAFEVAAR
ncbi:uncharacterized protein BT62DRAFT_931812 [Guyanagaster necrorhizus]|uniref:RNA polymerase II elongation factor ELL N-terminal domain-containing protein n=1 Tax=Guyanagaster necrorhizus TaxID=856835 RepID=A0A9P7VTK1_9AGAR|nr:uncharacterized protein BT62DRAFT_931812 [Guyanagaster necrorhizus MCA 3950]KAG7446363.1 hypothetical protein BT62DRAFT_931812 [Guyanagaster necrorhizus MCA 3950]